MDILQERIKKEQELALYMGYSHANVPKSLMSTDEKIYEMIAAKNHMENILRAQRDLPIEYVITNDDKEFHLHRGIM